MMLELSKKKQSNNEIEVENPHLIKTEPFSIPENTTITRIDSPELIVPSILRPRNKSKVGICDRTFSSANVNINDLSCDCDYWLRQKSRFPKTDPRRICGHLWDILSENSFSKGGYGNEHLFFPLTSKNYLLSTFKINNKIVQIMSKGESPWVDVVAQNRSKNPKYDQFGYQLNQKRWAGQRSPNSSPLIKIAISMHRFEFLSTNFEELPKVPENAIKKHARNLEQIRNKENYHKKYPHLCYVCNSPINAKHAKPLVDEIKCQYCGKINIIVPSGYTNTPERIALYNKYNGTYSKEAGSICIIENQKDKQLSIVRSAYKNKKISEESFKKKIKLIKDKAAKVLIELENQKKEELKEIKKAENIYRKKTI